ncbi:MAG: NAD(P) transhydrogenase subunit alpha [Verrucomicrobiota bacterium]
MVVFIPNESRAGERRCAVSPETVKKYREFEVPVEVLVETGLGEASGFSDEDFRSVGATVLPSPVEGLARANIVLGVRPPDLDLVKDYQAGSLSISLLDPKVNSDLVQAFAERGVNAISLEMIPRTTLAQKMDVQSSQSSLAGFSAVITAAQLLGKVFPMMMTPAGTISPARVFVIGVGVAGLQAIATAKRLGARVEAYDTRPDVEEQVKSLGAKYFKIDIGKTGQTDQGYAKELSPEQIELQKKGMARACANADVVITTAKVFGRPAPRIVTKEMLAQMRPGALVVDLAADSGGNVEGTVAGEVVELDKGIRIVGTTCLEATVARDASGMLASNLLALIDHFYDKGADGFGYREDDEILQGCLVVKDGKIIKDSFKTS